MGKELVDLTNCCKTYYFICEVLWQLELMG
jgi:hypothetical protein